MKQVIAFGWMVGEFLLSEELRIWLRLGMRPLVVCVALLGALWLGAWLAPGTAQAETNALACPMGMEDSGGLCYAPCKEGYVGIASTCWSKCPVGQIDDGAFCRKPEHIFAKASYGRTAGVPLVCASNQESQGGLCYPRCAAGYYGAGPVCWQACRSGYADHGATCYRSIFDFYFKGSYGRGAGGAVSACPLGMERSGSLCYPRCQIGFSGAGPVCFQVCPAGYKDDSAFCRKDAVIVARASFDRGVGQVLNAVPEAADETVRTAKDTPVDLQFSYEDLNDEINEVIFVQRAAHGELDNRTYTPASGFEGVDSILWKVSDGKNESNVAIVTILVGSVGDNAAPVALDRTVDVGEDTAITITVTCTDADADELIYQLVDKPQHGEYLWLAPNQVVYTPTLNFVGTDQFTFRSYDGRDVSNVSTVTLNVAAANDAPVAVAQAISTTRNSNTGIVLAALDAEGDSITYSVVTSPTHGTLSGVAPDLVYVPEKDFVGEDGLIFRASDAKGAYADEVVTISVLAINSIPVASSLALTTSEESPLTVDLIATDADGDEIVFSLVTSPTHGLLAGEGSAWVYSPEAGYVGADGLTFRADDGQAYMDATVNIQVTAGPAEASVVGFVYDDANGNGQPDDGETGVSGVRVSLTGGLTSKTDATGAWRIEQAPLGQYNLRISSASGVTLAETYTVAVDVGKRGFVQGPIVGVQVTGRSVYLPRVTK